MQINSKLLVILICLCLMPLSVSATSSYLLARGDELLIPFDNAPWTIWIFSNTGTDHVYDIKNSADYNATMFFQINTTLSESLDPGTYTIVKQFPGANNIKEISYVQKYNSSNFLNEYLVSPFKNVDDVDINGMQPNQVLNELKRLLESSDDRLEYATLIIEEPLTVVKVVDRDGDYIYLSGVSNLQPDSFIKILWDADKLVSESDYFFNSFYTYVKSDKRGNRYWETGINVSFKDLSIGEHWIDIIAKNHTTTARFYVGELEKEQKPLRNETVKYLWDGVIVTPTPELVEVVRTVPVTVIKTVVITTQPFPRNPLGEEYNPSVVPDTGTIIVPLLFVLFAMIILRGKVWK